jgi:hypothetical protein
VVHGQATFAAQKFRSQRTISSQDPRKIGG